MDELTFDGQIYVSSKRAAQITGYAKDYVGQLCREGRVIARLVGRNWYVLETSVREHRFGIPEVKELETPQEEVSEVVELKGQEQETETPKVENGSSWQAANYSTDPAPELLPALSHVIPENNLTPQRIPAENSVFEQQKPKVISINSSVVNEMQSAWHDWFTRTNELAVSKETLLEEHDSTYLSGEGNSYQENSLESGSEPVSLEKVSEAVEKMDQNEETVPIKRTYRDVQMDSRQSENRESFRTSYQNNDTSQEGVIIRERKVIRRKKSSILPKVLLIMIAVIAIITTAIGSGILESYFSNYPNITSRFGILMGKMVIK